MDEMPIKKKLSFKNPLVILGLVVAILIIAAVIAVTIISKRNSDKETSKALVNETTSSINSSYSQSPIDENDLSDDSLGIFNKDQTKSDTDSILAQIDGILNDKSTGDFSDQELNLSSLNRN